MGGIKRVRKREGDSTEKRLLREKDRARGEEKKHPRKGVMKEWSERERERERGV